MTHQQRIDKAMMHIKQADQINAAIKKDMIELATLAGELAQENARLRVALMRAERYNGTSPQDDYRS